MSLGQRLLDEKRKYYRGSLCRYYGVLLFFTQVHSLRKVGKAIQDERGIRLRAKRKQSKPCILLHANATRPRPTKTPISQDKFRVRNVDTLASKQNSRQLHQDHLPGLIFSLHSTIQFGMDLIAGKSSSNDDSSRGDLKKGVKYLVDTTRCMRVLPEEYVLPLQPEKLIPSSRVAIPVIDLSGLGGSIGRRMMTVEAIGSACAHWGFFRIINHGIKVSLMEEMLKVVDGFFNLAAEEKMNYASEDVMNPVRYGTSLNTSQRHALHWRDYLRHFGHPIDDSFHLWPRNPSNYRVVAKEYLEEVWGLAIRISGAISEALGLERDYVEKSLGEGCQIVASNYYPLCPEPHRTLGLAAHSDHGGITILMQNEVDGLQVKHQGEWVAVHHVPGTLVVNIGDYIEILSNGKYKSVEHRAVVNAERTRISIAMGHGPEMTATVAPASPLVDEKSWVKYRPIMYKDHMRAQQSSAVRGKSPLQALMTNTTIMK